MPQPAHFPTAIDNAYAGTDPGAFAGALGIDVRKILALERTIFSDLSDTPGGICWWPETIDLDRRVRISDYLFRVTASISTNLIEAQLHLIELRHWEEVDARRFGDAVVIDNGRPVVRLPRSTRPADDLPAAMTDMHQAGIARSLGSALDCVGGMLVGVLALPLPIVTASYQTTMKAIGTRAKSSLSSESIEVAQRVLDLATNSGPPGWIAWVLHFRNTLVHRARPISINEIQPTSKLYGPNDQPIVRVRPIELLAANPHWSDVDAFAAGRAGAGPREAITLSEPAGLTLEESVRSAAELVTSIAVQASQHWEWRKDNPRNVSQPASQWSSEPPAPIGFAGFDQGRVAFTPSQMISHSEFALRMQAAHLFDHQQ